MNTLRNIISKLNFNNILVLLVVICGAIFGSSYITSWFNQTEIEQYIEDYNEFKEQVEITKEYSDSLEKLVDENVKIINQLQDSIIITTSNLDKSNQRVDELEEMTEELSQSLTDSIIRETPTEVLEYVDALENENEALKESNENYEILTNQLYSRMSTLEEAFNLAVQRADSLENILVLVPDAPSNPDKILGFIPKPTRTQTFILGVGTGIIANIVINKDQDD